MNKLWPIALTLGALATGCTLLVDNGTGAPLPEGARLIRGELLIPREGDFGGAENQGMTLAALIGDPAGEIATLKVGVPFNPSQTGAAGGDRVAFSLTIPAELATQGLVLFFQTTPAAGSGDFLGNFLARLSFPTGLGEELSARLPAGNGVIDLGLVRIDAGSEQSTTDNLALAEENPLGQLDTDNDGLSDLADPDDDGDGIIDLDDSDDDEDAVLDALLEQQLLDLAGIE